MMAILASRYRWLLPLLALVLSGCDSGSSSSDSADMPSADAGRRMYIEGVRPSGEPMTAIVAGDVPVLGTQFSCESCHGRSGMGAAEGKYIVPPIAGQFLFAPSPQPARPAYTQESLARLLRDGETPGGRNLGELMPRYEMSDDEVAAMTAYLAGLSSALSPGVDDTVIRFATVITEDVDASERAAVLDVLNTFVADKNSNTRLESERWDRGYTPSSRLATVHRDWVLEEWTLAGPPETWDKQLEQRYREAPVFAMLSGLSDDSWGPIGRFCERNEIACLFPGAKVTDATEGDFYTLYYSRGLELEADLIANHLAAQPVSDVIQVYCGVAPAQAASSLRTSLQMQGLAFSDLGFECDDALPVAELIERSESSPDAAIVLWLGQEHLTAIEDGSLSDRVYFSSTLLGEEHDSAFLSVTGPAFMAHPFRLPGQFDPAMARFEAWARSRGVEITAPRRQAEAFFACLILKDAVKHIGRFFIREFMLDVLDHAQSIVAYLPFYPRPTLGPGQRFVNKGGYVLPIVGGQPVTQDATWILP
jgi:cytochrome c553